MVYLGPEPGSYSSLPRFISPPQGQRRWEGEGERGEGEGDWTKYIFFKSFTVPFPSSEFRWIQQRVHNKTELELACASPNIRSKSYILILFPKGQW
jgi:hypothetical protein